MRLSESEAAALTAWVKRDGQVAVSAKAGVSRATLASAAAGWNINPSVGKALQQALQQNAARMVR